MTAARAFDLLWRTVACAAALTVIQMTIGALVLAVFGPGPPMPPNTLGWLVVSNLSTAAVLSWAALRSSWRGTPLAAALAAILFVVSGLTGLVEAIFFDVLSPRQAAVELVRTLLTTAAFGTVLVMILGRRRGGGRTTAPLPTRPARWWLTRLAVSDLAYVVFYFAAGMFVFPYVKDFYAQRALPPPLAIAGMQLFVRGPLFVAVIALLLAMSDAGRAGRALLAGAILSVLGGVAPLLIPNPFFPESVRWAHFVEVVTSNFAFGCLVGWLLGPDPPRAQARSGPAVLRAG